MAWYKPGRDGPSRRSRPKVWAPMGGAGCLVLAVTVIVGVVIALMSVATRTVGAADGMDGVANQPSPSSQPSFGQRVEVPEAGFAVTFPADWEHQDAATFGEDWWDRDYGVPRRQHERFIADGGKLRARSSRSLLPSHEQCYVYDWTDYAAVPPAWNELEDAYEYYTSVADATDAIWVSTTYLELPAGRVVHRDTLHDTGWYWRDYLFTDRSTWFMLVCGAEDPPEDRWLSIAETFEFLPAEE